MSKHNQLFLPHASVSKDDFYFYSKGKAMWTQSADFRDTTEDKFRM